MIVLGIDPGISGAFAFFNVDSGSLDVVDMPISSVNRNGKSKSEVSPQLLFGVLRARKATHVVIERVGALPGQAGSGLFQFGRSVGMIEGVIAALELPVSYVAPVTWRNVTGVRGGKDASRQRAMELFPAYAASFSRKKDDGRAEASLIAWYGVTNGLARSL